MTERPGEINCQWRLKSRPVGGVTEAYDALFQEAVQPARRLAGGMQPAWRGGAPQSNIPIDLRPRLHNHRSHAGRRKGL